MPVYHAPSPLLDAAWYPYASSGHTPVHTASIQPNERKSQEEATYDVEDGIADFARKQTWCFLSSVRNVPIRLVDADSGQSRTSYGIMDHVERFVGPTALVFSPYGDRFYAGHDSYLTIHELSSSGLNAHKHLALAGSGANIGESTKRIPVKDEQDGSLSRRAKLRRKRETRRQRAAAEQRGIVSALSVTFDAGFHSSPTSQPATAGDHASVRLDEMLAVGTFTGNVGLYALGRGESAGECCVAGWKESSGTGISHLAFHPAAPNLLFVQTRRSDSIRVYDIRLLCGCLAVDFLSRAQATYNDRTSGTLVAILHPDSALSSSRHKTVPIGGHKRCKSSQRRRTQQRLFFDLDQRGKRLCAGDANGVVRMWDIDLSPPSEQGSPTEQTMEASNTKSLRSLLAEYEGRLVGGDGDAQNPDPKAIRLGPLCEWEAHDDAVTCASFHPTLPLLLTLSGSRKWDDENGQFGEGLSTSASESDSHSASDVDHHSDHETADSNQLHRTQYAPALKLWDVSSFL
ncbi:hypothetical protein OC846_001426 [Tilletia horrida]|uniref:Uncharacterized protein n=1 Tax=Tilletia horrida TaxID=155126 RepID=A0AAN6JT21_9BASI|nr:hypothetical protein OC845_001523 [Tilletia horrida]KAK0556096.1 hypothetical protein OC846_001426 [Tilletia horrida]KAK0568777.1 hypothetical protein OC861_001629 [Tilletia horrida]